MALTSTRRLSDGTVLVRDDTSGREYAVTATDWARIQALPPDQQRAELVAAVAANTADPNPRSETDEAAMDTLRDASSGEAHQEGEKL